MKKVLSMLVFCFLFTASFASAKNLDQNPNYVYVFTGSGQSIYLDLRTVAVHEYNPPHYTIGGTIVIESDWTM